MTSDKLPDSTEADRGLLQRVQGFLHDRGYVPHRTLEISVVRSVVMVHGRVPTFYLRQIAVECIKRVAGVIQVIDLIEVADDARQQQPKDNSKDVPGALVVSTRHRMDVPNMAHTAHDVFRP